MNCEHVSDQLEAYLLGDLDEAALMTISDHLEGCPSCRRLAAELADALGMLPLAIGAASPYRLPTTLKARVLAALPPAAAGPPPLRVARVAVGRRPRPTASAGGRLRAIAAVAAALLLGVSLAWNVFLSVTLAQERSWRTEFANLSEQQELVFEVVDSPRAAKALMRAVTPGSTAYGKLFVRPDLPHVVIMAARLAPAPAGQGYYLWLTRQGQTYLAGQLTVNDQGFAQLVFDADQSGPTYDAAVVTLQAEPGPQPAGTTILRWERS